MLLNFYFPCCYGTQVLSKYKKLKFSCKVDSSKTDAYMGLNDKNQELGEDEANEVHNDQHATKPAQIHILPENQDDH